MKTVNIFISCYEKQEHNLHFRNIPVEEKETKNGSIYNVTLPFPIELCKGCTITSYLVPSDEWVKEKP